MQLTRRSFFQALGALGLVGALPKSGNVEIESAEQAITSTVTVKKDILGNGTSDNPLQIVDVYICPDPNNLLQIDPQVGDIAKMWDGNTFAYDGSQWILL